MVSKEALLDGVWPGTNVSEAVLTHCIISGDPENEFFCDGLSEEVINGLTQVAALRVVAHSSSFSFKGRDVDAREIGRQLNVGSVLEGSVRKTGRRLRITAQLIDANDGFHVWSERYDRRLEDIFAIQDEISLAILSRVKGTVPGGSRPSRRSAHDLDAYELYLRGRGYWHRRFKGALPRAMECFQQAIEKDPGLAVAYTGLADSLGTLGIWGFAPPSSVFPRAVALVEQALALEPELAEAHASLGLMRMFRDWDWAGAVAELSRAVAANPGNALIRLWNSHVLSIVGAWDAAIDEVLLAQDLDPLSPAVAANAGWTYYLAKRHEQAVDSLRGVLAGDPRNGIALFYMGYPLVELGRLAEAQASFEAALDGRDPGAPRAR